MHPDVDSYASNPGNKSACKPCATFNIIIPQLAMHLEALDDLYSFPSPNTASF